LIAGEQLPAGWSLSHCLYGSVVFVRTVASARHAGDDDFVVTVSATAPGSASSSNRIGKRCVKK